MKSLRQRFAIEPGGPGFEPKAARHIVLFVDAQADRFKTFQNVIHRFRPDHELLETFHAIFAISAGASRSKNWATPEAVDTVSKPA